MTHISFLVYLLNLVSTFLVYIFSRFSQCVPCVTVRFISLFSVCVCVCVCLIGKDKQSRVVKCIRKVKFPQKENKKVSSQVCVCVGGTSRGKREKDEFRWSLLVCVCVSYHLGKHFVLFFKNTVTHHRHLHHPLLPRYKYLP